MSTEALIPPDIHTGTCRLNFSSQHPVPTKGAWDETNTSGGRAEQRRESRFMVISKSCWITQSWSPFYVQIFQWSKPINSFNVKLSALGFLLRSSNIITNTSSNEPRAWGTAPTLIRLSKAGFRWSPKENMKVTASFWSLSERYYRLHRNDVLPQQPNLSV